jgi:hypothetical protein
MNEKELVEAIIDLLMNRIDGELDEAYKLPETDEDREQYYYVADVLEDLVAHIHIFYGHKTTLREAMKEAVDIVETWDEKKKASLALIHEARMKERF